MKLEVLDDKGIAIAEAARDVVLLPDASAVAELIEYCFNRRVRRVLLHAANLSPEFFRLQSGMAGIVLEKCRQYRIRVAFVLDADQQIADRFRELIAEENKRPYAHFTSSADDAREWLASPGDL